MKTEKTLDFLLNVGRAYLECGSETYRCDEAIKFMFDRIGTGTIKVFVVPTQITVDIVADGQHHCGTEPVSKRNLDLSKVNRLNTLSRNVSEGKIDIDDAICELENIRNLKQSVWKLFVGSATSAAFFSLLLGGHFFEFISALFGGFLAALCSLIFKNGKSSLFLTNIAGGLIAVLVSKTIYCFFPSVNQNIIIISSMLPLFPGISLVTSVRDVINGDLISGMARFGEALLVAASLAVGASLVFYLIG